MAIWSMARRATAATQPGANGFEPAGPRASAVTVVQPDEPPATRVVLRLRPRRAAAQEAADGAGGCGYFESSLELSQGALVQEVDSADWPLPLPGWPGTPEQPRAGAAGR